jgi:drug/metabolite transporter (DMT)-like permease
MVAYFWALARLEASMAAMIISLSPLIVLSLLALRGEKVTYRHTVRLILALAGVYLLLGPGGAVDWIGVGLLVVAMFSFALHLVSIQWYLVHQDARTVTFYVLLIMTAGVSLWWWMQGARWHELGWRGWLAAIVLAVVSTYVARLCLFAAVARIGGGQMALFSPLETLLTVIWSMLFLDEHLTLVQWLGGALILTSAVLAIRRLGVARWRPRWRVWTHS